RPSSSGCAACCGPAVRRPSTWPATARRRAAWRNSRATFASSAGSSSASTWWCIAPWMQEISRTATTPAAADPERPGGARRASAPGGWTGPQAAEPAVGYSALRHLVVQDLAALGLVRRRRRAEAVPWLRAAKAVDVVLVRPPVHHQHELCGVLDA